MEVGGEDRSRRRTTHRRIVQVTQTPAGLTGPACGRRSTTPCLAGKLPVSTQPEVPMSRLTSRVTARARRLPLALSVAATLVAAPGLAQPPRAADSAVVAERWRLENELRSIAVVDRKLMVPMRDGVRMQADVYRPKDASRTYPVVFSRTPYNFNWWDVRTGAPRSMATPLDAVKRGYAYVEMNERGHFFSEGNYDILGAPVTDGEDAIAWLATQPWSNGKVGLIGCSSTAEWQMAVAARNPKGLAAIIPQGFGAGVGRVGPYYEQGNWYRGGAVQMLFIAWLYGQQNQVRPMFPPGTSQEQLIQASRLFDLAPQMPPVDWAQALRHLPSIDIIKAVNGPTGIYADSMPVASGGAIMRRTPLPLLGTTARLPAPR
jgi:predicted acyl esterase